MKRAGLSEALQGLRREHRKPGDDDRPPPTPWPGRKVKPIAGQLDLEGNEVGPPPLRRQKGARR